MVSQMKQCMYSHPSFCSVLDIDAYVIPSNRPADDNIRALCSGHTGPLSATGHTNGVIRVSLLLVMDHPLQSSRPKGLGPASPNPSARISGTPRAHLFPDVCQIGHYSGIFLVLRGYLSHLEHEKWGSPSSNSRNVYQSSRNHRLAASSFRHSCWRRAAERDTMRCGTR